jgi:hypothetical protein
MLTWQNGILRELGEEEFVREKLHKVNMAEWDSAGDGRCGVGGRIAP